MLNLATRLFPLWAVLFSIAAFVFPAPFASLKDWIVPLLSLVMFFMGLTLTVADFRRVILAPFPIGIGVCLQFLLMPLLAWLLATLMALPQELTVGLIIVGCCAGGTASNVICYLAKGDVALSISMTMVSTLLGVVLTPLLCRLYIDQGIEVDTVSMLLGIARMVLLPVLAGLVINLFWHSHTRRIEPVLPLLSIAMIILIIAIIVALNEARLQQVGTLVVAAVVLHNTVGLGAAFGLSRLLGMDSVRSRTIAIEVGMQNSGLGVALAIQYFTPLAALPGAVFSVWHNISGSLLAAYWSRDKKQQEA